MPQPVKLTLTVWLAASEVKPVSEYATEVAPAGIVTNLVVVPSLTEAIPPNRLLVNSISPETSYWLVTVLQAVGVAVTDSEQRAATVHEAGAEYVAVAEPQPAKLTVTVCDHCHWLIPSANKLPTLRWRLRLLSCLWLRR